MFEKYLITKEVMAARKDLDVADELIEKYLPFIKKEVYKYTNEYVSDSCDELSVAMIAFHEAINSYNIDRGSFINYAALVIRSRLIDFSRQEARYQNEVSLDAPINRDANGNIQTLKDVIPSANDLNAEVIAKSSTIQELNEFSKQLATFDIDLKDVAESCPHQERTLAVCRQVLLYALNHRELLDQMVQTHHLPIKQLVDQCDVPKKTLERHRKYLVAILLIQTNGYLILRDHIKQVLKGE